jgi:hypothetical protein
MARQCRLRPGAAVIAALGVILGWTGNAAASPLVLTIDINGTTETFTDSGTPGTIQSVSFTVGTVSVVGEFAQQTIGIDTLTSSSLFIENAIGAPVATITAALSGQNFTGPAGAFSLSGAGTWLNSPGSIITQSWYDDPANALGASTATDLPGNLLASHTYAAASVGTDAFSFAQWGNLPVPDDGLFSMSEGWTFTLDSGGSLTSRGQDMLAAVPEPGSLLLLGAGVACLTMARRGRLTT